MCPQMSPFVLICPITRYFTAFLIPVTLQPKGIGQANQAPAAGSVPISANSNPSVGGFLFALANSKVCSKQLEILSAGTTGYGEMLFSKAFDIKNHTVETVAHARAAEKYIQDA